MRITSPQSIGPHLQISSPIDIPPSSTIFTSVPWSREATDEVISILSRYKKLMSLVEAGYVSIKKEKYVDVYVNEYFYDYT